VHRQSGSEFLKSKGRIVGLDKLGNEVEHSFTDPEVYYEPWMEYALKPKDSMNPDGPKERVCVTAGINEYVLELKKYTLPFNQKNFESLYSQRPGKSSNQVSLIILEEGIVGPRKIENPDKFSKTPFEELWEEATTPKFKMDRSFNDNLEASHIR
jgi:hypothetical protein